MSQYRPRTKLVLKRVPEECPLCGDPMICEEHLETLIDHGVVDSADDYDDHSVDGDEEGSRPASDDWYDRQEERKQMGGGG